MYKHLNRKPWRDSNPPSFDPDAMTILLRRSGQIAVF
jgi:hypothetical protein